MSSVQRVKCPICRQKYCPVLHDVCPHCEGSGKREKIQEDQEVFQRSPEMMPIHCLNCNAPYDSRREKCPICGQPNDLRPSPKSNLNKVPEHPPAHPHGVVRI